TQRGDVGFAHGNFKSRILARDRAGKPDEIAVLVTDFDHASESVPLGKGLGVEDNTGYENRSAWIGNRAILHARRTENDARSVHSAHSSMMRWANSMPQTASEPAIVRNTAAVPMRSASWVRRESSRPSHCQSVLSNWWNICAESTTVSDRISSAHSRIG